MLNVVFAKLERNYTKHGMSLAKALDVWREVQYSPEEIQEQVASDINMDISLKVAEELHSLANNKTDMIATVDTKPDKYQKFVPLSYKDKRVPQLVKFTSTIKNNYVKVGEDLYQDKKTKKYWTLKESLDQNGKRGLYLVAVEVKE